MRTLLAAVALLLCISSTSAQTATFVSYGSSCPTGTANLAVTGVPKLGTTFKVSGMKSPLACTRKLCQNCNDFCNSCSDGSILALGLKRVNVPFFPGGCRLLTDASVAQIPWAAATKGVLSFAVPNNPALLGQKFTMQRADLSYRATNFGCSPAYQVTGFRSLSNGVEGTLGF